MGLTFEKALIEVRKFLIDQKYLIKCDKAQRRSMYELRRRVINGEQIGTAAVVQCMSVMGYELFFEKSTENIA